MRPRAAGKYSTTQQPNSIGAGCTLLLPEALVPSTRAGMAIYHRPMMLLLFFPSKTDNQPLLQDKEDPRCLLKITRIPGSCVCLFGLPPLLFLWFVQLDTDAKGEVGRSARYALHLFGQDNLQQTAGRRAGIAFALPLVHAPSL